MGQMLQHVLSHITLDYDIAKEPGHKFTIDGQNMLEI